MRWATGALALAAAMGCSESRLEVSMDRARIIGGQPASLGQFPEVTWLSGGCSGVLIHPEMVVFGAHCGLDQEWLTYGESVPIEVMDGGIVGDPVSNDGSVALYGCTQHPNNGIGTGYDIAFCLLEERVGITVPSIVDEAARARALPGQTVWLVGFGFSDATGSGAGVKRWAEAVIQQVPSISDTSGDLEFIIGDDDVGTCRGDSGGPAYVNTGDGNQELQLLGILSSGLVGQCGVGWYTDLLRVVPWLEAMSGLQLSKPAEASPESNGTAQQSTKTGDDPHTRLGSASCGVGSATTSRMWLGIGLVLMAGCSRRVRGPGRAAQNLLTRGEALLARSPADHRRRPDYQ